MDRYPVSNRAREKLRELQEQALKAKLQKTFFMMLCEYVAFIKSDAQLAKIVNVIVQQQNEELTELRALEQYFLDECTTLVEQTENLLKSNNIQIPLINQAILTYHSFLAGNASALSGFYHGIKQQMDFIVTSAQKDKTGTFYKLLKDIGSYAPDGRFLFWHYENCYQNYEQELNRIEMIQHTRIWYYWIELSTFYEVFNNYPYFLENAVSKGDFLKVMELKQIKEELDEILTKEEPKHAAYIKANAFRDYLNMFQVKLENYMQEDSSTITATEENIGNELMRKVPLSGKYKTVRKIASLLASRDFIDNLLLVRCFPKQTKVSRKKYLSQKNKEYFDNRIKNCFKTLRKLWNKKGYDIEFRQDKSRLIKSSQN